MKFNWLLLFVIFHALTFKKFRLMAQNIEFDDVIYDEDIYTVQLYREPDRKTPPIIGLYGDAPLTLRFDDLSGRPATYSWTLFLCDNEWKPTILPQNYYLKGTLREDITEFAYSFGGAPSFVTYRTSVPSENLKPLFSGNYILYVFKDFDFYKPVFTKRLFVVENITEPQGVIKESGGGFLFRKGQDIMFTVDVKPLSMLNPLSDIVVSVYQNFRKDNTKHNLKPMFYQGTLLDFRHIDGSNSFAGWNEYRLLDLRTLNIRPSRALTMTEGEDHVMSIVMAADSSRNGKSHTLYADLNGTMQIHTLDGRDPDTDAKYVRVSLRLYSPDGPEKFGSVYLMGQLCDYALKTDCKMNYDEKEKIFHKELFLKQGVYSYLYVRDRNQGNDSWQLEGSHSGAENNYLILVYFKDPLSRVHRIVGFKNLNSLRDR